MDRQSEFFTPDEITDLYHRFGDAGDMMAAKDILKAMWESRSGTLESMEDFYLTALGAIYFAGKISGIRKERARNKDKNAPHFRQWLVDLRAAEGMTVEEAAALLDVSPDYYFLIEDGQAARHMDISLAKKIADAFTVDPAYVLEMEKELNG